MTVFLVSYFQFFFSKYLRDINFYHARKFSGNIMPVQVSSSSPFYYWVSAKLKMPGFLKALQRCLNVTFLVLGVLKENLLIHGLELSSISC